MINAVPAAEHAILCAVLLLSAIGCTLVGLVVLPPLDARCWTVTT
jgi:hypothetical protein